MKQNNRGNGTVGFVLVRLGAAPLLVTLLANLSPPAAVAEGLAGLRLDSIPGARFRFDGMVGRRVKANVENWLLVAPQNNPGLLDMFARRDSGEKPDLVPWAGEFVGKYLISAVQAMRTSEDPRLRDTLQAVVDRLLELQAEDGYLGPWPKDERLLGHWDLWGHDHVMLALMLWYEHTGDQRAMEACRRIGDLVCNTYLHTDRRVHEAGSHEMNMAIIQGMARLHRTTGEPRYLAMAEEVLADFEQAGDYLRQGLRGEEFYRTPRPRWESLHCLQGMVELYQISRDPRCRQSFLHHWASIRRFDLRNTGGFSSGEQATGSPYRNDAIETCCVIAWAAVMIDALRLTGDSSIADDLELATLNAVLGSQHPSGAWCTYNTPMNGRRVPSHVDIRFQARPDAPQLNCCSVNGPRGYGMLTEWGVMQSVDGLAVNYYGPMQAHVRLADGTPVTITQETAYPVDDTVTLRIETPEPRQFTLSLRIPGWSTRTEVAVNGQAVSDVAAGRYVKLPRQWTSGDEVTLRLDMSPRYEPGDLEQYGRVSLYRGPILLALDQQKVAQKVPAPFLPRIDVLRLSEAKRLPINEQIGQAAGEHLPWLVVELPTADGGAVRLVDFASAGATGGEYASWLPASGLRPPRPAPRQPADRSSIGPGWVRFSWRGPAAEAVAGRTHSVVLSDSPSFNRVLLHHGPEVGSWLLLPPEETEKLEHHKPYYWKIVSRNEHGDAESIPPYKQFVIDPAAPPMPKWPYGEREHDRMVTAAPLAGNPEPEYGALVEATGWKPAPGPDGLPHTAVELDGKGGMIKYKLVAFPEEEYTVSVWVAPTEIPHGRYGQVFSAWSAGMDDPLRLVIDQGKLFARIEAGRNYSAHGVDFMPDRWYHVAAVKRNDQLMLYVDGQLRSTADAPSWGTSAATDFAVGGNPNYQGAPEFLAARFADLEFYARALSEEEVRHLSAAFRAAAPLLLP